VRPNEYKFQLRGCLNKRSPTTLLTRSALDTSRVFAITTGHRLALPGKPKSCNPGKLQAGIKLLPVLFRGKVGWPLGRGFGWGSLAKVIRHPSSLVLGEPL